MCLMFPASTRARCLWHVLDLSLGSPTRTFQSWVFPANVLTMFPVFGVFGKHTLCPCVSGEDSATLGVSSQGNHNAVIYMEINLLAIGSQ